MDQVIRNSVMNQYIGQRPGEVMMRIVFSWKLLLPLLVLLSMTACETRTYPGGGGDDDDDDGLTWVADSVAITYAPTSVVGLDSLAVEITAFAYRNGVARSGLRVYWGFLQLDEATGYFSHYESESANVPPGRATGVFISGSSPSGRVRLFVEPAVGYGGDSVDVILHKRPQLTLAADTSMADTTIDIVLPLSLYDDRQQPLADHLLNFDAFPQHGVVTAMVYTDYNGRAEISFDAQGHAELFTILGWMPQFSTSVRDSLYVDVWETGL
jgi:hypothetical protein